MSICGWLGARLLIKPWAPRRRRVALAQWTARRSLKAIGVDLEVEGEVPRSPFILVSNHRGYLDIGVLQAAARVVFLSKTEIGQLPVIGWVVRLAGTVFVDRGEKRSGAAALQSLGSALEEGQPVALFPEGKTGDGLSPGPFRHGAFRLARALEVPVVPVAVEYSTDEVAWTNPNDFSLIPHFFSLFSRKRIRARVVFGSARSVDDIPAAAESARIWIGDHLDLPERREALLAA